ncbi:MULTISPECIES: neutral zinc metallopeptidase [unclassified Plantactinospora]|uniref:neutral zinc metallopeptidase n=1 Tax=unclassified Plantactinospora TaxID=2631981 RepID=UPI001F313870|nr:MULTISPECIES: neutral zinc metallopeptidase [unclassified Plantactinospora]
MMRPLRRTGRFWPLLALIVTLVVAGACFVGGTGGGGPEAPDDPGTSGANGTGEADGTMTVDEFRRDIDGAVRVAEEYWTGRFKASGERFQPIRRITAYQREGEVDCAGQGLPRNNAVYCSAGDFIAYDVNWAVAAFRQVGDAFLYYLLGHEYAHGVQVRLGIRYEFTIQQELQADCMAGAYLGDSVRAGALTIEEGDLDELSRGLRAVADEPGQPWFAEGAHGTAEQRTDAFFGGYERSLDACDLR